MDGDERSTEATDLEEARRHAVSPIDNSVTANRMQFSSNESVLVTHFRLLTLVQQQSVGWRQVTFWQRGADLLSVQRWRLVALPRGVDGRCSLSTVRSAVPPLSPWHTQHVCAQLPLLPEGRVDAEPCAR